jgi:hypothetical protein
MTQGGENPLFLNNIFPEQIFLLISLVTHSFISSVGPSFFLARRFVGIL